MLEKPFQSDFFFHLHCYGHNNPLSFQTLNGPKLFEELLDSFPQKYICLQKCVLRYDITISDYDKFGLWNDQILQISTQKDFDRFTDENVIGLVTITDESDSQSKTDVGYSIHVISFEYIIDNKKIYGKFSMYSNSDINYVSLNIHG